MTLTPVVDESIQGTCHASEFSSVRARIQPTSLRPIGTRTVLCHSRFRLGCNRADRPRRRNSPPRCEQVQPPVCPRIHRRSHPQQRHRHVLPSRPAQADSGSRLGSHQLSPEHRSIRPGLALESQRNVERSRRQGILHRRLNSNQRNDSPLLWLSTSAPRLHP